MPSKHGINFFAIVDSKALYTENLEIYTSEQPEGPYLMSKIPADIIK